MPAAAGQAPSAQASWRPLVRLAGIVDVVGPRADGRLVVATRAGLYLLRPGRVPEAFARGQGGYVPEGGEPYIALSPDRRVPGAGCAFVRDDIYALDVSSSPGVVRIDRHGRAGGFADLPSGAFPSGIAFDLGGAFGYRLLVTTVIGETTTLYAIDCRGRMTPLTRGGPRVEGGIAVAPKSFGKFAGDLLAPDENSGRIFAFGPKGGVAFVVDSRLPAGADIGVEGIGFVPPVLAAALLPTSRISARPALRRRATTTSSYSAVGISLARGWSPVTSSWRPRQERERSPSAVPAAAPSARSPPAPPPPTAKATSHSRQEPARNRVPILDRTDAPPRHGKDGIVG